jgi:hypothetical protein
VSPVTDYVVLIGVVDEGEDTLRIHTDSGRERWLDIPRDDFVVEPIDAERSRVVVDLQTMEAPLWDEDEVTRRLGLLEEMFGDAPFTRWNLIPETRYAAALQMELVEEEGAAQS